MSLRNEAMEIADHVVASALRELRMAVRDYRERACWRVTFHTVMVRELTARLRDAQRAGRAGVLLRIRIAFNDDRRTTALAQCEANTVEKQLMALCMSKMPPPQQSTLQ